MPQRLHCDALSLPRQRNDERAAIVGSRLARDESALDEAVENAGQRRALVREGFVQRAYGRRSGLREMGEDVSLALRNVVLTKKLQIKADPVRRPMNCRNEREAHESRGFEGREPPNAV
jgi:hypothetical protein